MKGMIKKVAQVHGKINIFFIAKGQWTPFFHGLSHLQAIFQSCYSLTTPFFQSSLL
jgi:hypothetical protein